VPGEAVLARVSGGAWLGSGLSEDFSTLTGASGCAQAGCAGAELLVPGQKTELVATAVTEV